MAELKRSKSPIKMLRHIRTYISNTKTKDTSNVSISGLLTVPPYDRSHSVDASSIPRNPFEDPPHQRSSTFPTSNANPSDNTNTSALSRREQNRSSENLSPDKQVLLLQVISYFEHAGHLANEETAELLLRTYHWNIDQTLEYCKDLVQAVQGPLVPIDQKIHMNGAVNDEYTSCYIDSLLFAMFARLTAFEGLLSTNLEPESDSDSDAGSTDNTKKQVAAQNEALEANMLQTWLKMFVNQLRSGKLVNTHVIKELRQHLYTCGWNSPDPTDPPGSSRQEDSSELFMFLTEKLRLPYLPLEQRLLHGARFSADDDKVITERMLQIAIPCDDDNPGSSSSKSLTPNFNPKASHHGAYPLEELVDRYFYDNTLTGIRRLISSGTGAPLSPGVEVPVSAWQVLELLPFYSSSNEQGGSVRATQSQYPSNTVILPLILKRYSFGADMQAHRTNTLIDIPRRLDFTRFVSPDTPSIPGKSIDLQTPSAQRKPIPPIGSQEASSSSSAGDTVRDTHSSTLVTAGETARGTAPANIATVGASSSIQSISSISVDTGLRPPPRQYSMSFLTAADGQLTPVTPPPLYSPARDSSGRPTAFSDDKKGWPSNPPDDEYGNKTKYMLELKSVVCHIGTRLDSGHYRSYVADEVGTHPHKVEEPNWLRHDDLDPSGQRVRLVERDSKENSDMEADWAKNAYILFYELRPINS
ncbi:hypothetical protein BGZ76_010760 [Entomortierella beljakovae]|nr:hypothetical protein BGZ76_010760 [Entomortierella beljakovae]